jgi:hypothetical protein
MILKADPTRVKTPGKPSLEDALTTSLEGAASEMSFSTVTTQTSSSFASSSISCGGDSSISNSSSISGSSFNIGSGRSGGGHTEASDFKMRQLSGSGSTVTTSASGESSVHAAGGASVFDGFVAKESFDFSMPRLRASSSGSLGSSSMDEATGGIRAAEESGEKVLFSVSQMLSTLKQHVAKSR